MKVYVVTGIELGWDCVVAVFDNNEAAEKHCKELDENWNEYEGDYIIHEQELLQS